MTDGPPSPKRVRVDSDDLMKLSREELVEKLREQKEYVALLESRTAGRHGAAEDDETRETEESLKKQNMEAARRENTLVLRLTNKEQELQDCMNQIAEMKQTQTQSVSQLRHMLLDPAVNLVYQRMAREMDKLRENLKQTQNDLSAWKFTPDSQTGKRLMAKCRMLLQENEDLGKMIASGRTAKLEGEIALQKNLVQEMKKNQEEMDELVGELEEDMEGLQSMIYALQQQLKETREQLAKAQAENSTLKVQLQSQPAASPTPSPTPQVPQIPTPSSQPPGAASPRSGEGGQGGGDTRTADTGGPEAPATQPEDVDMETDAEGGVRTATEGEGGGRDEREEEAMEHTDSEAPQPSGGGEGVEGAEETAATEDGTRTGSINCTQHNHREDTGKAALEEGVRTRGQSALPTQRTSPAGSPAPASPLSDCQHLQGAESGDKQRSALAAADVLDNREGAEPVSNGMVADPPTDPSDGGE